MRIVIALLFGLATTAIGQSADPPSYKGTWVREMIVAGQIANQVVATFTDSRLTVTVRSGSDKGHISVTMSGEYAVTKSGIVCAVVTGIDADISQLPTGDDFVEPIGPAHIEINGQPMCFRATIEAGTMHVSEIRIPSLSMLPEREKESGMRTVMAMAGGAYKLSKTDAVPFPKLKAAKSVHTDFPLLREPVDPKPTPLPQKPLPSQGSMPPSASIDLLPPSGRVSTRPMPVSNATPVVFVDGPPLLPVAAAVPPVPGTRLEGTWFREMIIPGFGGGQVILTFKGDRLRAKFVEFGYGEGTEVKSGSFEFNCTCVRGTDEYVVGRVLGVDIDVKEVPEIEMSHEKQTALFGGVSRAEGEPYSFRCEWRNGDLFISDVRINLPGETSKDRMTKDLKTALTSGRYKQATSDAIPLPKIGPKKEMTNGASLPVQPTVYTEPLPLPRANLQPLDPNKIPPLPAPPSTQTPPLVSPRPLPNPNAPPFQLPPPGTYRNEPIPDSLRRQWEKSTIPPNE